MLLEDLAKRLFWFLAEAKRSEEDEPDPEDTELSSEEGEPGEESEEGKHAKDEKSAFLQNVRESDRPEIEQAAREHKEFLDKDINPETGEPYGPPKPVEHERFTHGALAGAKEAHAHAAEDEKQGKERIYRPTPHGEQHLTNINPDDEYETMMGQKHPDWHLGYHHGYQKIHNKTPLETFKPAEPSATGKATGDYPNLNGDEYLALKELHSALRQYRAEAPKVKSPEEQKALRASLEEKFAPVLHNLKRRVAHSQNPVTRWRYMNMVGSNKNRALGEPTDEWHGLAANAVKTMFGDFTPPGEPPSKPEGDYNALNARMLNAIKTGHTRLMHQYMSKARATHDEEGNEITRKPNRKSSEGTPEAEPGSLEMAHNLIGAIDTPEDLSKLLEKHPQLADELPGLAKQDLHIRNLYHDLIAQNPKIQTAAREAISLGKHPETGEEQHGHFINLLHQTASEKKSGHPKEKHTVREVRKPAYQMTTDERGNEVPVLDANGKPVPERDAKGNPKEVVSHYEYKHPVGGTVERFHALTRGHTSPENANVAKDVIKNAFFKEGPNGEPTFYPNPNRVHNKDIKSKIPKIGELSKNSKAQDNLIGSSKRAFLSYLAAHPDVAEHDPTFNELLRLSDVNEKRTAGRIKQYRAAQEARKKATEPVQPAALEQPKSQLPTAASTLGAPPGKQEVPVSPTKQVQKSEPKPQTDKLPPLEHLMKHNPNYNDEVTQSHDFLNTYETPEEAGPENHPRRKAWHEHRAKMDKFIANAKKANPPVPANVNPNIAPETPEPALPHEQNPKSFASHIDTPYTESNNLASRLFGMNLASVQEFIARVETILRKDNS